MNDNRQENNNTMDRLMYFLLGGLIGAGTALLFAPQSGEKTRNLLVQKTQEGKEYLVQKGQELKEQATEYVDRGLRAVDEGLRTVEEQKNKVARAAEAGREAYKDKAV